MVADWSEEVASYYGTLKERVQESSPPSGWRGFPQFKIPRYELRRTRILEVQEDGDIQTILLPMGNVVKVRKYKKERLYLEQNGNTTNTSAD